MTDYRYALFDTGIGRCGIAWGPRGVAGIQLPETRADATRARLLRRFPDARESAPAESEAVRLAVDGIVRLLRGERTDLSTIPLDMTGVPTFHRRVYEAARTIPAGATLSYGAVAARAGSPGSARAVGQALGRNPFAIVVPCHRVLAAGGKPGGFSARGGVTTKLRMLGIEGADTNGDRARPSVKPAPAQASLPLASGDDDGRLPFDGAAAVRHLRAADPALARVIDAVGPLRLELKAARSLFGVLTEAIVYQQLTGKAAATIYGRVCALFPRASLAPTPEHILRVSDEQLGGAGLSRAKVLAVRDLAEKARAGVVPSLAEARAMSDDELVTRLTAVRGVGRWTVEMLLIFRLGRPDVLPVDDYGIRKGFAVATRKRELPSRADVGKRGARWRPFRTAASWYLWRAAELGKV